MVTQKKVTQILTKWGLEAETISNIYSQLSGDKQGHVFYIGNDFVLKITPHLEAIQNHITLSHILEKAGLTIAIPVETKDNKKYVIDNELYCLLTRRVKGEQIKTEDLYQDDYASKARYIGEIIGQLHQVLANYDEISCNDANLFETVTKSAIPKCTSTMGLTQIFYDDYLNTFGTLYPRLPKQVIHRDLNPSNILIWNTLLLIK